MDLFLPDVVAVCTVLLVFTLPCSALAWPLSSGGLIAALIIVDGTYFRLYSEQNRLHVAPSSKGRLNANICIRSLLCSCDSRCSVFCRVLYRCAAYRCAHLTAVVRSTQLTYRYFADTSICSAKYRSSAASRYGAKSRSKSQLRRTTPPRRRRS